MFKAIGGVDVPSSQELTKVFTKIQMFHVHQRCHHSCPRSAKKKRRKSVAYWKGTRFCDARCRASGAGSQISSSSSGSSTSSSRISRVSRVRVSTTVNNIRRSATVCHLAAVRPTSCGHLTVQDDNQTFQIAQTTDRRVLAAVQADGFDAGDGHGGQQAAALVLQSNRRLFHSLDACFD